MISPKEFLRIELERGISPFNPKFVKKRAQLAQMMEPYKHLKTIDYGAGTGVYAEEFRKAGFDVVAQDIWKEHRDFMKENYPGLKVVARPVKAEFMLFIEVAEHMADSEIDKAIEKIDPEFILFSSTSNRDPYDEKWGHVNIKEQPEWVKFWKDRGYEVKQEMRNPTKWTKLLQRN